MRAFSIIPLPEMTGPEVVEGLPVFTRALYNISGLDIADMRVPERDEDSPETPTSDQIEGDIIKLGIFPGILDDSQNLQKLLHNRFYLGKILKDTKVVPKNIIPSAPSNVFNHPRLLRRSLWRHLRERSLPVLYEVSLYAPRLEEASEIEAIGYAARELIKSMVKVATTRDESGNLLAPSEQSAEIARHLRDYIELRDFVGRDLRGQIPRGQREG